MSLQHIFILCSFLFINTAVYAAENTLHLGQFSNNNQQGWQEKEFDGHTQYTLVTDTDLQQRVLQATSHGAASGLFYEQRIDLTQTPWLNWSWKTTTALHNINERDKSGDDFVARIYIVIDGGVFFWNTLALNYVWSSSHVVNESWPNPYTSNATMLAVETGKTNLGKWLFYQRNVRQDLKQHLGQDIRYIDAIAIMTDTDNSQQSAITSYADIYFSSQPMVQQNKDGK